RVADGRPVLGICVGAQVMFEAGEEHGLRTAGLGLLPGTVTRLAAARVPHMGWNTVAVPGDSRLGMRDGDRFYFVHSYAAQDVAGLRAAGATVTTCHHDVAFAAAVERGPLAVTQFHPEKSGDAGAALLRTWVAGLAPAAA
ncbi:MAG TPA: imidazole glycerol phosphate synthase subunit HisH, partial [Pilimelia sp.]|nr:imidazole glycerol phosphate synthase subunit HisH [Pilimelia sp.]